VAGLLEYVHSRYPDIPSTIASSGELPDALRETLQKAVEEFKATFQSTQTQETTA
jgi:F0F1-type ATP synthase alpha subunit